MDAKEEILGRIGRARVVPVTAGRARLETSTRTREKILEQFGEYAADYKANVARISLSDLAEVILGILDSSEKILIPGDLPREWISPKLNVTVDPGGEGSDLDGFDSVITGCALAIAETGTVVLDAGIAQGRRAISLIPDHHVCVVFEEQVLDSVPEAVARLKRAIDAGRPLTWISGPSATSDIELSRVEGVHGPRKLDILITRRDS